MVAARPKFENQLEELHEELIEMGTAIEDAIDGVVEALKNQDTAKAQTIIAGDRMVNDMEKAIETRCLSLILRQQPVARDLRSISTALKVVTDMERIGDHAADIAEIVVRLKTESVYHIVQHIPDMAKVAKEMVHNALEAFVASDVDTAKEIIPRDDELDALFNKVKEEVIVALKGGDDHVDQCIDVLMIAKYMERIGDHAVNICEWTEFHETGVLQEVRIL